jgi:hypothetical protein
VIPRFDPVANPFWAVQMLCRACGSEKLGRYMAEIAIHFPGLNNINKPAIFVFPTVFVCVDCGTAEFTFSDDELRLLAEGDSAAVGGS